MSVAGGVEGAEAAVQRFIENELEAHDKSSPPREHLPSTSAPSRSSLAPLPNTVIPETPQRSRTTPPASCRVEKKGNRSAKRPIILPAPPPTAAEGSNVGPGGARRRLLCLSIPRSVSLRTEPALQGRRPGSARPSSRPPFRAVHGTGQQYSREFQRRVAQCDNNARRQAKKKLREEFLAHLFFGAVEYCPDGVELNADGVLSLLFAQHPEVHHLLQLLPADIPVCEGAALSFLPEIRQRRVATDAKQR